MPFSTQASLCSVILSAVVPLPVGFLPIFRSFIPSLTNRFTEQVEKRTTFSLVVNPETGSKIFASQWFNSIQQHYVL